MLEIIARSTQPCIGIYVAVNSLAPGVVGGICSMAKLVTTWVLFLLIGIVFAELSVGVIDTFGWCVFSQCIYLWVLSFGVNKLENSAT